MRTRVALTRQTRSRSETLIAAVFEGHKGRDKHCSRSEKISIRQSKKDYVILQELVNTHINIDICTLLHQLCLDNLYHSLVLIAQYVLLNSMRRLLYYFLTLPVSAS